MLIRGLFLVEGADFDGADGADGGDEVVDLFLFGRGGGGEDGEYFLDFDVDELLYGQRTGVGLGGLLDVLEGLDDVLAGFFLVAGHEVEAEAVVEVVGVAEGGVGGVGVVSLTTVTLHLSVLLSLSVVTVINVSPGATALIRPF